MNKIVLLGRLTKDPEVKVTSTGKTTTSFSLAVDRPFSGKDGQKEVDFINIVAWNKTAEVVGNNVSKGQRLLVEGPVTDSQIPGQARPKSDCERSNCRPSGNLSSGKKKTLIRKILRQETALKAWDRM